MNNNLIVFTRGFPYNQSETTFILNEINHLYPHFENIYIICTMNKGKERMVELPDKVQLIEPYNHNGFLKYVYYPIGAIAHIIFQKSFKNIGDYRKESIINKLYSAYDITRANYRSKKIIQELKELEINNSSTVLYSYWFNDVAYIASLVNREIFDGKSRLISRAHGFDLYDEANNYPFYLKALAIKNVDCVFACSQNGCNYLKNKFPEYSDKIRTSYLGTNDYGLPDCTNGDNDGVINIISCSYLKPVKRVELLIEALSLIKNIDKKIIWTHFGDGNNQADYYREVARQLINNGIEVNFIGDISNNELMKYYKNNYCDLFVNVSASEGLPVSIMEAISFGIPVLATDVGGVSEIVDPSNGFLINKDITPDELAKHITRFVNLPIYQRDMLRIASRKKWEEKFDSKNNYQDFVKFLLGENND